MRSLLCIFCLLALNTLACYELAIASMFRNEAPYLKEWIEYHKMVGVEHFYLYNNNSTDNWEEVLFPYIQEGLVEVEEWSQEDVTGSHVRKQLDAFRDALHKALGISTWVALIDIDEFLLPMKEMTVSECLKKRFHEASGVYVSWRMFGTGGVTLQPEDSLLMNLTSCSKREHSSNWIGKSIVKPKEVQINKLWYLHHVPVKAGKKYYNGDAEEIDASKGDIQVDETHDLFLRINHYYLRDESYFRNVRLLRWEYSRSDVKQKLWNQYYEFSLEKDKKMVNFIRTKHRIAYETFWQAKDHNL